MNTEELLEKYKPLLKHHWLPISLGFFGLIFFAYGLIGLFSGKAGSNDITFESSSEEKAGENKFSQISVDVEGGVMNPGVYKLNSDSRIQDALVAAGGISAAADRDWVAKNLNLGLKVKYGMKIYVPGSAPSTSLRTTRGQADILGGETSNQSSLININSASMGELDGLAGVGPVTAQKIIDNRQYSVIEELLEKKVVSSSVFEKIKEKITAY